MRALNRKLQRDLWRLRGQVIAIAMVIASGVGVLVMALATHDSLEEMTLAYYERYRFADVFAQLNRAPLRLENRISAIPGVQAVETRITKLAILDVADFPEPVIGLLTSIPDHGESVLNRLALRRGRLLTPGRPDEIVLSEPFAEAHALAPGDTLSAIMNGHKRTLEVVGIALSPEYVYAIGPGALMPDDERFGVGWMGRSALEAAYDLEGAFNDVSLGLLRGVDPKAVIDRLDPLLARYGGTGAYARKDQISNWFLMSELDQLKSVSTILPAIFLGVAAFLTNMVLARLVATERAEIGLLKAFGYSRGEIGWHYAKLVIAITSVGIVLGWLLGAWLGRYNTAVFSEYYRFPFLLFRPQPVSFVAAAVFSLAAALVGTMFSVRRAAMLAPAEAMQPPTPPIYKQTGLTGTWLARRLLDHPTRIVLRQIERWPLRSALTITGLGLSVGVLVMALQWMDSIDHLAEVHFFQAQRQDMTIALTEPQSISAVAAFRNLPGVLAVEPARVVSADFKVGDRSHRGAITGVRPDASLNLVYDVHGEVIRVPPDGVVVSTKLAEKLGVRVGDSIQLEFREGRQPVRSIPVVRLFETYIGIPAYMDLDALNRLLLEPPSVGYVNVLVDEAMEAQLFRALKASPKVSAIVLRNAAARKFYDTVAETLLGTIAFFTAFAAALGVGVAYNSARVALSERARELSTLRVLGFHRSEIAYILLGEVAMFSLIALPVGCAMGWALSWFMAGAFETELYRVPLIIQPATFGTAMLVALVAAALSAALVRRRLDQLDLIAVLKTRD